MNETNLDPGFEVGWFYTGGKPSEANKKEALEIMLKLYGKDPARWVRLPEIREDNTAVVHHDFGRGPLKIREYSWAVYGVLKDKPTIGYVPEGVRLPCVDTLNLERLND